MASWLDDILTNAGNALVATQSPFGALSPQADPQARQAMINNALLTIGAGMMSGARQGQGPLEAFGNSWMGLNQQGMQRGQQQLQNMLLMGKMGEMQKKNQTRETLKKMTPPEGYTPETWGAFVDAADAKDLLGIWQDQVKRQRDRAAIGSMGGFPGMGGPGAAPSGGGAPVQPTGDPVLDAIARSESGGRMVTNPTSGATGTFQFMPATWRDLVANNPNAGLTPEGINDPQQQAIAAKLFRGQINEAFGGTATPGQTYLGWFLGPQGARSISMMPTSTPIDDALTRIFGPDMAAKVKSQNRAVFNGVRTSGDLIATFDRKMAGVQPTTEAVTPIQYTPGQPQGQPAPQIDYQSDPIMQDAFRQFQAAKQRGDLKAAEEAMRRGAERRAELQKQADSLSTDTVTTNDGVFLIDKRSGRVIRKLGDRPSREEGTPRDFTMASDLRKEFGNRPVVKDYLQVAPHVQAIRNALPRNTRAADINIVFAFAKMLDPTSVVREGEQITIGRTGGVWETIKGWAEKLNGGGMLTPEIRKAIQQEAESRFETYRSQYAQARAEFEGYFRDAGLDPEKKFTVPRALDPYQPEADPPPTGEIKKGTRARNPQTGQEILWDGKQWLDVKTLKPVTGAPAGPQMPTR